MAIVDLLAWGHVTAGSHKGKRQQGAGALPGKRRARAIRSDSFRKRSANSSPEQDGTEPNVKWSRHATRPVCAGQGENGSSRWSIRRIHGIDSGLGQENQVQEGTSASEDAGDAADHAGGDRGILKIVKVAHQVDRDERGEEQAERS